jgi:hypothetical protein
LKLDALPFLGQEIAYYCLGRGNQSSMLWLIGFHPKVLVARFITVFFQTGNNFLGYLFWE